MINASCMTFSGDNGPTHSYDGVIKVSPVFVTH